MRSRFLGSLLLAVPLAACGGGASPGLGYGLPSMTDVTYEVSDTVDLFVTMLNESAIIFAHGEYDVSFAQGSGGLRTTMTIRDFTGEVAAPMGDPISMDQSVIDGDIVFTLDEMGNPTMENTPSVSLEGALLVSPRGLAHTFFPTLPGGAVSAGDQWTDTVTYEETGEVEGSETSILTYTVVGDRSVDGRTVTEMTVSGTTEMRNSAAMAGVTVQINVDLAVDGTLLFDQAAGLMVEFDRTGTGTGNISVAISPVPLPVRVTMSQNTRLAS